MEAHVFQSQDGSQTQGSTSCHTEGENGSARRGKLQLHLCPINPVCTIQHRSTQTPGFLCQLSACLLAHCVTCGRGQSSLCLSYLICAVGIPTSEGCCADALLIHVENPDTCLAIVSM